MIEEIQGRESQTWEDLRQKTLEHRRRSSKKTMRVLPLLIAVAVFGAVGIFLFFFMKAPMKPLILPESVSVNALTVADSVTLQASDFVRGLADTGIEVSFSGEIDEDQLGAQTVTLLFTRGREGCTRETTVYRFHLETEVTVKQEEADTVDIRSFLPDERVTATFAQPPQTGACGVFHLLIRCDAMEYPVTLTVTEEIPPVGTGLEIDVEAGRVPPPSEFVMDIVDQTSVTVTYKEQPTFTGMGKQPVTLVLTDSFGNTGEVIAYANVVPNPNGPQFSGLDTIFLQVGATVSYKTGVSARDAQDGSLAFTVETGNFDSKTPGEYTVYYCATDSDGNTLIAPRTVVVESHTGQLARESAQAVLDQIIKPDMTRDEKIVAVFNRVRYYVLYVGNSDKSSLENAAYEGFTKEAGDCYTYYAMVKVMLDMLDIENLEVTRIGGTSHHWWNLVKFEDGKYYHVDASPPGVKVAAVHHEKMTQTDLITYTNDPNVVDRRPNYYVYDHTLPEYQNIEIAQ